MTRGAAVKTILVIDDDPAVLRAYGRLLSRLGHRILLEDDVDEVGRDPGRLREADLVILDQRMPRTTGLGLLERFRRVTPTGGGPAPKILLVSAYLNDDIRRAASSLGVAEVIEKPVNPGHLIRLVCSALDGDADRDGATLASRA